MQRQVIDLGFILRQFPAMEFSMDTFGDRLRLQKFIYLLQAFDVYLGYDYSWYLRGPYCSNLAACAFALRDIYDHVPDTSISFPNGRVQRRFADFKRFIRGREKDNDFLEIAASLHFLRKTTDRADDDIINQVAGKQARFTEQQCREIYKLIKERIPVG